MRSRTLISFVVAALLIFGVIVFLAIFARPAGAQAACARMEQIAAGLAQGYGEAPVSRGLTASGQLVVIFAAPDGATFTMIIVSPAGIGCAAASGTDWQEIEPAPKGDPS